RVRAGANPRLGPPAMDWDEPSSDMVTWFRPRGLSLYMPSLTHAVPHTDSMRGSLSHGSFSGQNQLLIGAQSGAPAISCTFMNVRSPASRNHVTTAPTSAANVSARACRAASPPFSCSARSVAAAAVPVGKRRPSTLIIWRLVGTARNTPMAEITITHGISHRQRVPKSAGMDAALNIISAGIAFTSPALVMEPAAPAVDWRQLFSRIE